MKPAHFLCSFIFALILQPLNGANVVGFVNVTLVPGFNLISKPLRYHENTVAALLKCIHGSVPEGLSVYLMENGSYRAARYDSLSEAFEPADVASAELQPGAGFFVWNPTSTNITLTVVGEVVWGRRYLPAGYSMVGSVVPIGETLGGLNFPAEPGDLVFAWNPFRQAFESIVFDDLDGAWLPGDLRMDVAEAFIVFKRSPAYWFQPDPIFSGAH